MVRFFISLMLLLPATLLAQTLPSSLPASRPSDRFTAFPEGSSEVRTPGFHKLVYHWTEDGQPRSIPFTLYLPQGYRSDGGSWPMLTFLAGLGDRGADPGMAMAVGVPLEIGRSPELAKWMPMMVLTPQCPNNNVWDSPGMSDVVLRLIHAVGRQFAVDTSRLYVTGFSDGGRGAWVMAAAEPRLFAAIAPVVSREHSAQETAARLAGTGVACLILSGQKDVKSEPASTNMANAMRQHNIDVTHAIIPDAGHFIWRAFYSQRLFYEWLLLHQKGQRPPDTRPTAERFVDLYRSRQQISLDEQIFDHRLQRGLDRFEPYWFIDNCAMAREVGLRPQWRGRSNVFVTQPLSADVPCRLQTTRQLAADKITELAMEVGNLAGGEWELIVRVNEEEHLRQIVSDTTAPGGWLPLRLSLRAWAGKEARLQLIQSARGTTPSPAYWAQVKLIETPAH